MGKRENKDIDRKWLIGCSAHYRLEKWLGANTQGKTPVFVWWCSPFATVPPGVPKLALSWEWDMEFEPVSLLPSSARSSEFCPDNPQGLNSGRISPPVSVCLFLCVWLCLQEMVSSFKVTIFPSRVRQIWIEVPVWTPLCMTHRELFKWNKT